ncbi:MAG: hypothetical protein MUF20_12365 [Methylotetracoccus sp.]|nr:hypothetical protein [Methylotetracoccus sp.]
MKIGVALFSDTAVNCSAEPKPLAADLALSDAAGEIPGPDGTRFWPAPFSAAGHEWRVPIFFFATVMLQSPAVSLG